MSVRIAFFITAFGLGGAEAQVSALARAMKARGHQTAVVRLVDRPDDLVSQLRNCGINSFSLSLNRYSDFIAGFRRAVNWIKTWEPDVVHSHMAHASFLCRLIRPVAPIPRLICTAHSRVDGGVLRTLVYRATDRLADLTTNVSPCAVDTFVKNGACKRNKIVYVPNLVDCGRFGPDEKVRHISRRVLQIEGKFVFLAVGRFDKVKDYPTLIHAYRKCHETVRDVRLLLAGDGAERRAIENLCDDLGLLPFVNFLGNRADMPALMNAADCFVLSSKWEGQPLVLLEAMASARNIVCTEFGGAAELLRGCAVVVPPGDADALARAMTDVVSLHKYDHINERAREVALANHSEDATCNIWERIYAGRHL